MIFEFVFTSRKRNSSSVLEVVVENNDKITRAILTPACSDIPILLNFVKYKALCDPFSDSGDIFSIISVIEMTLVDKMRSDIFNSAFTSNAFGIISNVACIAKEIKENKIVSRASLDKFYDESDDVTKKILGRSPFFSFERRMKLYKWSLQRAVFDLPFKFLDIIEKVYNRSILSLLPISLRLEDKVFSFGDNGLNGKLANDYSIACRLGCECFSVDVLKKIDEKLYNFYVEDTNGLMVEKHGMVMSKQVYNVVELFKELIDGVKSRFHPDAPNTGSEFIDKITASDVNFLTSDDMMVETTLISSISHHLDDALVVTGDPVIALSMSKNLSIVSIFELIDGTYYIRNTVRRIIFHEIGRTKSEYLSKMLEKINRCHAVMQITFIEMMIPRTDDFILYAFDVALRCNIDMFDLSFTSNDCIFKREKSRFTEKTIEGRTLSDKLKYVKENLTKDPIKNCSVVFASCTDHDGIRGSTALIKSRCIKKLESGNTKLHPFMRGMMVKINIPTAEGRRKVSQMFFPDVFYSVATTGKKRTGVDGTRDVMGMSLRDNGEVIDLVPRLKTKAQVCYSCGSFDVVEQEFKHVILLDRDMLFDNRFINMLVRKTTGQITIPRVAEVVSSSVIDIE